MLSAIHDHNWEAFSARPVVRLDVAAYCSDVGDVFAAGAAVRTAAAARSILAPS